MLDCNIDGRDHPYILGTTNPELPPLIEVVNKALASGATQEEVAKLSENWTSKANLCTYHVAVSQILQKEGKSESLAQWNREGKKLSNPEARDMAKKLIGKEIYWDWDKPRGREGYYLIKNGVEICIDRGIAFAPYADILWMETKTPDLEDAKEFSEGVKSKYPEVMLAYNLSPSFNWSANGLSDKQISEFQDRLGDFGYVWQFITVAGFHASGLISDVLAREFSKNKMLAYVNLIQRQEEKEKVETLTHQKWSGASLVDAQVKAVTGGTSSTLAMGKGVTESQFGQEKSE